MTLSTSAAIVLVLAAGGLGVVCWRAFGRRTAGSAHVEASKPSPAGEAPSFQAAHLRCPWVKRQIMPQRAQLAARYTEIWTAMRAVPIGTHCRFGRRQGPLSIKLDPGAVPEIDAIAATVEARFSEYRQMHPVEIWFSQGEEVRMHNDVPLYLSTEREVALQVWVLLEACLAGEDGLPDLQQGAPTDAPHRAALECIDSEPRGLKFATTDFVITHDGRSEWTPGQGIGGDAMALGDMMVFRNGTLHGVSPVVDPPVFRAALVWRVIRKDAQTGPSFLLWFRELLKDDPKLRELLASNAYFRRLLTDEMAPLDGTPLPPSETLHKQDRNDYLEILPRLGEVRDAI